MAWKADGLAAGAWPCFLEIWTSIRSGVRSGSSLSGCAALFAFAGGMFCTGAAHAAVTISSAETQNMTCSSGVCTPTATDAVLNVSDLENLLASGNVFVTTTGSGGVQADDIDVVSAFSWSTGSTLALDAYQSIAIASPISVEGQAGVSLTTNDGGNGGVFSISRKGSVFLQNLSSQLTINGTAYTLVNTLAALANAIASNPGGAYALANSYDASADGAYTESPIQTTFSGALEGLGNSISNLSIKSLGTNNLLGLFNDIFAGSVKHINLLRLGIVTSKHEDLSTGGLAGINDGYLFENSVSGSIKFRGVQGVGGLVGSNSGTIEDCFAAVDIGGTRAGTLAGGLIAINNGTIKESFSTGTVTIGDSGIAGGLTGANSNATSTVENSYASGAVTGGASSKIGGLIGEETKNSNIEVTTSYSTGAVTGGVSSLVGGFAGVSYKQSDYLDAYWDTTTSGTSQATGRGNSRGIVGETTEQLQSGLPTGFDPTIWGEQTNINNGLPYLLANPPPKK